MIIYQFDVDWNRSGPTEATGNLNGNSIESMDN